MGEGYFAVGGDQMGLQFIPTVREDQVPETGARFNVEHLVRPMKVYPVHESELDTISFLNPLVAGFLSVGSALLLFAIGLLVDLAVEGQFAEGGITAYGKALAQIVAPTLIGLGILSYLAGGLAWRKRRSVWRKIRDESRMTTQ